jgi:hypothetical protein
VARCLTAITTHDEAQTDVVAEDLLLVFRAMEAALLADDQSLLASMIAWQAEAMSTRGGADSEALLDSVSEAVSDRAELQNMLSAARAAI